MPAKIKSLFEDNHLLVVNKPAELATMGLPEGEETLLTLCKQYIKAKYDKPGNVYLGVVSRLDFPASGVIVFARTSKAAARLNDQFREHATEKIYHAIVEGHVAPKNAMLTNFVCEDAKQQKMWVTARPNAQSKEARLHYRLLKTVGNHSLLEITLETGRKHQIRLQMSHARHPILGDVKYGSRTPFPKGIALHAAKLTIQHPTTKEMLTFEAPHPKSWGEFERKTKF